MIAFWPLAASAPASQPVPARQGGLPVSFMPNAGQANPAARFQAITLGGALNFYSTSLELVLPGAAPARVTFEGARQEALISGEDEQATRFNLLLGADPTGWRTGLSTYGMLRYSGIYEGIDLRYEGLGSALKGTYQVAPGADPEQIRWSYQGVSAVRHDAISGDLLIDLQARDGVPLTLREQAPVAWQEIGGERTPVAVSFVATQGADGSVVGFELGAYDHSQALVIDPTLDYATLIGGAAAEEGRDVTVDTAGNAYITGTTTSANLPQAGPPQATFAGPSRSSFGDAFIAKLNPAGDKLVYLTYLGGAGEDIGDAITVDAQGNAYVTGMTESSDFPVLNAYQTAPGAQGCGSPPCSDAFVTKLNAAGDGLVFSTYLGGSRSENVGLLDAGTRGMRLGIAVDNAGEIYVTGTTDSPDFPTAGQAFGDEDGAFSDIFVGRLSADGRTLRYSSYLGGSGADYSGAIAVDASGVAYITGGTISASFPTVTPLRGTPGGAGDVIIAAFDTTLTGAASLRFSTYFGGDDVERGMAVAVDGSGIYLAGHTTSEQGFPLKNALQTVNASAGKAIPREAFAAKLSLDGAQLLYSTYLGGSGDDMGYDMAIDARGRMHLVGQTASDDFPLKEPFQQSRREAQDLFVATLDPATAGAASLVASSYLGSPGRDYGYGIAVDATGNAVVTGTISGATASGLPVTTTIGPNASSSGFLVARIFVAAPVRVYLPALRR